MELSATIGQFPVPDLTIILDVLPTVAEGRRVLREAQNDEPKIPGRSPQDIQKAMERKTDLYAVRNRYLKMADGNSRFVVVDANGDLYTVLTDCLQAIGDLLNRE